jgi:hypothetical protein
LWCARWSKSRCETKCSDIGLRWSVTLLSRRRCVQRVCGGSAVTRMRSAPAVPRPRRRMNACAAVALPFRFGHSKHEASRLFVSRTVTPSKDAITRWDNPRNIGDQQSSQRRSIQGTARPRLEIAERTALLSVSDAEAVPITFTLTFAGGTQVHRQCAVVSREPGQFVVLMLKSEP